MVNVLMSTDLLVKLEVVFKIFSLAYVLPKIQDRCEFGQKRLVG